MAILVSSIFVNCSENKIIASDTRDFGSSHQKLCISDPFRPAHTSYTNSNGLTFNQFNNSLPDVTIKVTSGTIAGTSNDRTATAGYKSAAVGIKNILFEISDIFNVANIAAVQANNLNSGDITSSLLLNLTHKVQVELCDDSTTS
ncbi:hypothetical protein PENCOP_c010G05935 [Penicillium coprophilum]|uniref:L-asparaginase N-terminal domain-containing protein n=1 Tax=Penicillium coprophilum TaxID=36646 RepID=A0A1V6UFW1_9EURO|nr:hypothetical protein PENCOP_c010G05935 [Penicillium coprophilum]